MHGSGSGPCDSGSETLILVKTLKGGGILIYKWIQYGTHLSLSAN
jgi:hypothetical protein